jgi:hypothetical protein
MSWPRSRVLRRTSATLFVFLSATTAALGYQAAVRVSPGRVDVLRSVSTLAPDVVGQFRDPIGFKQTASGDYYVFDRRAHAVYSVDAGGRTSRKLVQIGAEDGRVIEPSAFDVAANGSFAVADSPNGRERVQLFDAAGVRTGGFLLPGRGAARVVLGSLSLNGVGTLVYTGRSVVMSQPDSGWLITEYGLAGTPLRTVGQLRRTGQESDRQLHLALNAGIPVPIPGGGFYFVFMAGPPAFRRYDAEGTLVYERAIQGREIDAIVQSMPHRWPRRAAGDGELPMVAPTIRAAAANAAGHLWLSFVLPYTYVYDGDGEKIRTVQFRGAGVMAVSSLAFTGAGRLLVTPGCYEFAP